MSSPRRTPLFRRSIAFFLTLPLWSAPMWADPSPIADGPAPAQPGPAALPEGVLKLGTSPFRRSGFLQHAALAPDGKTVCLPVGSDALEIVDAATGTTLVRLQSTAAIHDMPAFSPDGRWVAASGAALTVWEVASGRVLFSLPGDSYGIAPVAFSPDGRLLAAGLGGEKVVRVVDAASGKEAMRLLGAEQPVERLAFSPDGSVVAAGEGGYQNCRVLRWEAATGKALPALSGHTQEVHGLAFSPNGKQLVSASDDKTVRIWDATNGRETHRVTLEERARDVAFSPDETLLAIASYDDRVLLLDTNVWGEARVLATAFHFVHRVAFAGDGGRLMSLSADTVAGSMIEFWDPATGAAVNRTGGHVAAVTEVGFSADGGTLVTRSPGDRTARTWEFPSGAPRATIQGWMSYAAWSADGTLLAAAADKGLAVYDARTGAERFRQENAHEWGVTALAFSPDGRVLASGGSDFHLRFWDARTGQPTGKIEVKGIGIAVYDLAFSRDGRLLAVGAGDAAFLCDPASGTVVARVSGEEKSAFRSIRLLPDGRAIALLPKLNGFRLFEVKAGKELPAVPADQYLFTTSLLSPDGSRLALGGEEDTILLWNTAEGGFRKIYGRAQAGRSSRLPVEPPDPARCDLEERVEGLVSVLTFSSDGARLASGHDAVVRVWDVGSGAAVAELNVPAPRALGFSPDGLRLAIGMGDGTVLVWKLP